MTNGRNGQVGLRYSGFHTGRNLKAQCAGVNAVYDEQWRNLLDTPQLGCGCLGRSNVRPCKRYEIYETPLPYHLAAPQDGRPPSRYKPSLREESILMVAQFGEAAARVFPGGHIVRVVLVDLAGFMNGGADVREGADFSVRPRLHEQIAKHGGFHGSGHDGPAAGVRSE